MKINNFAFILLFIVAPFYIGYFIDEFYVSGPIASKASASMADIVEIKSAQKEFDNAVAILEGKSNADFKRGYIDLKIKNYVLRAELAETEEEREKGLSNRESMGENEGMLFLFDKPGFYRFWMKDMKFSLDFIWIRDNRVIGINKNVPPAQSDNPPILTPGQEVDSVLEIPAGICDKYRIQTGDAINVAVELE